MARAARLTLKQAQRFDISSSEADGRRRGIYRCIYTYQSGAASRSYGTGVAPAGCRAQVWWVKSSKGFLRMCRNIKRLRHPDHAPTDQELHDAALQFVRKISGFHAPSKANETAFNTAVQDVAAAGRVLFRSLHVRGQTEAAV
jgi:hypothetical protein